MCSSISLNLAVFFVLSSISLGDFTESRWVIGNSFNDSIKLLKKTIFFSLSLISVVSTGNVTLSRKELITLKIKNDYHLDNNIRLTINEHCCCLAYLKLVHLRIHASLVPRFCRCSHSWYQSIPFFASSNKVGH